VFVRSLCSIIVITLAGPAVATFELEDPAADIFAEKRAMANPGERSCFDLLVDSLERPQVYRAAVDWVNDAVGADPSAIATEAALKTFCIDHPKKSVAEAAAVLGGSPEDQSDN